MYVIRHAGFMRKIAPSEIEDELTHIFSKIHNVIAVVGFMIDKDLDTNLSQVWNMLDKIIDYMVNDLDPIDQGDTNV